MTNSISAININYVESLIKKEAEETEDQRIASAQMLINKFAKELKLNITAGSSETADKDEDSEVDNSSNTQKDEEDKTAYYNNPTVKLAQASIKGYLSDSKFATKYNNFVTKYGGTVNGELDLDASKKTAQAFISQTLSDSKFATRYNSFVSKYIGTGEVEVPQATQQTSSTKQNATQFINETSTLVSKSKYGKIYSSMPNAVQSSSANEDVSLDALANYNLPSILISKTKISSSKNVKATKSTPANVKALATEVTNLETQLDSLIQSTGKLVDLSWESDEVQDYVTNYVKLYNQMVDKKNEYDKAVKEAGVKESQNNDSKLAEINKKIKEVQEELNKLNAQYEQAGQKASDASEIRQMSSQKQILQMELSNLNAQKNLYSMDLLSPDTKLQKIPEDVAKLVNEILKITDRRRVIAYQTAELADLDTESDEMRRLNNLDQIYELVQCEYESELKRFAQQAGFTNYEALVGMVQPQIMSFEIYTSDLDTKIKDIEARMQTITNQIKTAKSEDKKQLESIYQIYELELASIQSQSAGVKSELDRLNTMNLEVIEIKDPEYIKERNELEDKILEITNKRIVISYQAANLADLDAESPEMYELNAIDDKYAAEQEKLEKQLDELNKKYSQKSFETESKETIQWG